MRLLTLNKHGNPTLTRNYLDKEIPPYAILSHTWEADDEEVTYEDILHGDFTAYSAKSGFAKILFCGEQAQKHHYDYFWVDSCCIDRRNSTELIEAINSMFRWYQNAQKCYVFLTDVTRLKRTADGELTQDWETSFKTCKWFKRGWTLQELLAPRVVEFYSRDKTFLGTKRSLQEQIHVATGIPQRALEGEALSNFPPPTKSCVGHERDAQQSIQYGISIEQLRHDFNQKVKEKWNPLDFNILNTDSAHISPVPIASSQTDSGYASAASPTTWQTNLREEILSSLEFEQMNARQSNIQAAQRTTCEWLLQHRCYQVWEDVKSRPAEKQFLWIMGKPGAGKSTMMKFLLDHAQKRNPSDELTLHFFFNARGDDLEKSTLGMYRALASQLLKQLPQLHSILDEFSLALPWTINSLQELLSKLIGATGARYLTCLIDALDECAEHDVREMVRYFTTVMEDDEEIAKRLSICFASRHYPTILVDSECRIVLETEEGHGRDLAQYISANFKRERIKIGESLKQKILERANGIFMWDVLVVRILIDEIRKGNMSLLAKKLEQIPQELSRLLKEILQRDNEDMGIVLLAIQWVLFAKRPLLPIEFYYALFSGRLDRDEDWVSQEQPKDDDLARFVFTHSKGLAEVTKFKKPTVQFIHESVRDFLLKEGGLFEIWPNVRELFQCSSHDRLKRCCQEYLHSVTIPDSPLELSDTPTQSSSQAAKMTKANVTAQFPFLEYSSQNVFYHANEAARGISQSQFLEESSLLEWSRTSNLLQVFKSRHYSTELTLSYLCADNNFAELLRCVSEDDMWRESRAERYPYPIIAAYTGGHKEALSMFWKDLDPQTLTEMTNEPVFGKACSFGSATIPVVWAVTQKAWVLAKQIVLCSRPPRVVMPPQPFTGIDPLLVAAEAGQHELVRMLIREYGDHVVVVVRESLHDKHCLALQTLLDNGGDAYTLNSVIAAAVRHNNSRAVELLLERGSDANQGALALSLAAEECRLESCRHLLDYGVDSTDLQQNYPAQALYLAVDRGNIEMAKTLLSQGINVNTPSEWGFPIQAALLHRNTAMIELLLSNKANINAKINKSGFTLLILATREENTDRVKLLLEYGASVNEQDVKGNTALHHAAEGPSKEGLRLLIAGGADIDLRNDGGLSSLILAACENNTDAVELLVKHGANANEKELEGITQLHHAAEILNEGILEILFAHGVDIDVQTPAGSTLLHLAVRKENMKGVKLLIDHGANINPRDWRGNTPLHYAAKLLRRDIVNLLMDYGADVFAVNISGQTPVLICINSKRRSEAMNIANDIRNLQLIRST